MITHGTATVMPMTSRQEAVGQGEAEYAALLAMLGALSTEDWARPTECPGWTVREMVAHINGAAEEAVRKRVQVRHMTLAMSRDRGIPTVDSLSAQQVADRDGRTPQQLLVELAELARKAPRARSKAPVLVRSRPMPPSAGALPGDTMAYLIDVIYHRDVWMHRIDIARATGCEMVASGAEPAIVAQVVRDLSRGWSATPFTLTLTGRVEGSWRIGDGGQDAGEITVDAVALCRLLSGRSDEVTPAYGGTHPDVVDRLRSTRILF
ncbi:MAG TPA: maleylpyruvate isomerase family mycothiol-dependent enzyme [Marmoricola sp.]|jgi:uncharacterized protein (TIGR03083 family)|nr:maleylpyruvate isomerase family mycothiol-dependent enzyme [Marmoricola sp.]